MSGDVCTSKTYLIALCGYSSLLTAVYSMCSVPSIIATDYPCAFKLHSAQFVNLIAHAWQ